jgi:hypothetical protein
MNTKMNTIKRILSIDKRLYRHLNYLILQYFGLIDYFNDISDYFEHLNILLFCGLNLSGLEKLDQKIQIEDLINSIEREIGMKNYTTVLNYQKDYFTYIQSKEQLYNFKFLTNFIYKRSKENIGSFILFEYPVIILKVQRRNRFLRYSSEHYEYKEEYLFQDKLSLKEALDICGELINQWNDFNDWWDYIPPFTPKIKTYFEKNIFYIYIYNSEKYDVQNDQEVL